MNKKLILMSLGLTLIGFSAQAELGVYDWTKEHLSEEPENSLSRSFININVDKEFNKEVSKAADLARMAYTRHYRAHKNLQDSSVPVFAHKPDGRKVHAGFVSFDRETRDQKSPVVHIALRGTEDWEDVLTDLSVWKKSVDFLGLSGQAHGGVVDRYKEIRYSLYNAIFDVLERENLSPENVQFNCVGHSLGGALATLALADLGNYYKKTGSEIKSNTFNAPRVFDDRAGGEFDARFTNAHRIWKEGDLVSAVSLGTTVIPGFTGFKHTGKSYALPGGWDPLENHFLKRTLEQIRDPEVVPVKQNHRGFWGTVNNYKNSLLSYVGWRK